MDLGTLFVLLLALFVVCFVIPMMVSDVTLDIELSRGDFSPGNDRPHKHAYGPAFLIVMSWVVLSIVTFFLMVNGAPAIVVIAIPVLGGILSSLLVRRV